MKSKALPIVTAAGLAAIGIVICITGIACESRANSPFHSDVVDTLYVAYDAHEAGWKPNIRVIRDEKRKTTCYYSHNGYADSSPGLFCLRDEK